MQTTNSSELTFKESYNTVNEIRNEAVLIYSNLRHLDTENKVSIFTCLSELHKKKDLFLSYYEFLRVNIQTICWNNCEMLVLDNITSGLCKFFEAVDAIIDSYGGIEAIEKLLIDKHFGFHSRKESDITNIFKSQTESDPLGHQFFTKVESGKQKVNCTDKNLDSLNNLDLSDPKKYLNYYCELKFVDEPDFSKIDEAKIVSDRNITINCNSLESFMIQKQSTDNLNGLYQPNDNQNNSPLCTPRSIPFSGYYNKKFNIENYCITESRNKDKVFDDTKSVTTNADFHSNFDAKSLKDIDIKFTDFITTNIPRDNTDLQKELKSRHVKTIGGFVGSVFGMIFCGPVGCLTGGGLGFFGGREVIKQMKKDKPYSEPKTNESKNVKEENSFLLSPSHNLTVKKTSKGFKFERNAINQELFEKNTKS